MLEADHSFFLRVYSIIPFRRRVQTFGSCGLLHRCTKDILKVCSITTFLKTIMHADVNRHYQKFQKMVIVIIFARVKATGSKSEFNIEIIADRRLSFFLSKVALEHLHRPCCPVAINRRREAVMFLRPTDTFPSQSPSRRHRHANLAQSRGWRLWLGALLPAPGGQRRVVSTPSPTSGGASKK